LQSYQKKIRGYAKKEFDANSSLCTKGVAWLGSVVEDLDSYVLFVIFLATQDWTQDEKNSFGFDTTVSKEGLKSKAMTTNQLDALLKAIPKNRETLKTFLNEKKPKIKTSLNFITEVIKFLEVKSKESKKGRRAPQQEEDSKTESIDDDIDDVEKDGVDGVEDHDDENDDDENDDDEYEDIEKDDVENDGVENDDDENDDGEDEEDEEDDEDNDEKGKSIADASGPSSRCEIVTIGKNRVSIPKRRTPRLLQKEQPKTTPKKSAQKRKVDVTPRNGLKRQLLQDVPFELNLEDQYIFKSSSGKEYDVHDVVDILNGLYVFGDNGKALHQDPISYQRLVGYSKAKKDMDLLKQKRF
jgi:hypothetical protein